MSLRAERGNFLGENAFLFMRSPRFARDDNFFKEKVVRSARRKGKRCRHKENGDCPFQSFFERERVCPLLTNKVVVAKKSADFMNDPG